MRPADEDRVVIASPVSQEWFKQGRAISHHHFHFDRHIRIDRRPTLIEKGKRIKSDKTIAFDERLKDRAGPGEAGTQPGVRNSIIDKEDSFLFVLHPRKENGIHVGRGLLRKKILMTDCKNPLMVPLKICRALRRISTGELIVKESGVGIVN